MKTDLQILILQDSLFDAELIERELRQSGLTFTAKSVTSREAFLHELSDHTPDIVLSDYHLGQFNGVEALRLCHERRAHLPFILVTGSLNEEAVVEFMKEGVDNYILKSSLKRLPSAVVNAIEKHRAEAQRSDALEALRKSEERFQLVARATNDAIWDWDLEAKSLWLSEGAQALFGSENGDPGVPPTWRHERLHPEDRARVKSSVNAFLNGNAQFWSDEYRLRRADGSYALVIDRAFTVRDLAGKATRMIGSIMDITELRLAEEKVRFLAYHDELTELPNRTLFENRLNQALSLAERNSQMVAVMLLDVDRLRTLNETLGHAIGDSLLKQVSDRLRTSVRGSDTVARFTGVGFGLLLTQIDRPRDAANVAERVRESFMVVAQDIIRNVNSPYFAEGHELFVTASVGISMYPEDGTDSTVLLRHAGAALHSVKEDGGNSYQFYSARLNDNVVRQLSIERGLRRALAREEFELHYQPQVNLNTGEIDGAEALIRWHSPELGSIPPAQFIPIAESSGLIIPIGEWCLSTACAQARTWQRQQLPPLRMSVNLSPRQFEQPNLIGTVEKTLQWTGLDPECLEFELTEGSIMKDADRAIEILLTLKDKKIQVAVDDFGSGYSSLSHLKRFPIDRLKIDQSFVRDATSDPTDAAIIMAIITLAHNLHLKVVAEGVETEEQLRFLYQLGCDEMQGFLFSRPLPADAFRQLVMKHSKWSHDFGGILPMLVRRSPMLKVAS